MQLRFTTKFDAVLAGWYPGSLLEMDEGQRSRQMTKFGSIKWVFPEEQMAAMRASIEESLGRHLPAARLLYWT